MLKQYSFRDYNYKLVILLIAISIMGIMAVGSAGGDDYQKKQILGFLMGLFLMIVLSFFDYSFFLRFHWILHVLNLGLLLSVEFFGVKVGGAVRWIEVAGIRFQPSEVTKIVLILFFAQFMMKYREHISDIRVLAAIAVLMAPPLLLIFRQPDLSTTIMMVIMLLAMLFVGGISLKLVAGTLAVLVPTAIIILSLILQPEQELIEPYQQLRILAWLHPEDYSTAEAFQQINSITAIGSGQLLGKGYNNNEVGSVKNGNFISEPQTDFIFAIIGEELGFAGTATVIVLLLWISLECLLTARKAKDLAGSLICTGMGTWIGIQTVINVCVTTGMLPNTGITLPFISAGLTSLVSLFIGMGFVLNVRMQGGYRSR